MYKHNRFDTNLMLLGNDKFVMRVDQVNVESEFLKLNFSMKDLIKHFLSNQI